MPENTQSGVYTIVNAVTGDAYIGSSVDIPTRMSRHRALLATGRHYNSRLQAAWNAFGEDAFLFDVLEAVEEHALLVLVEQRYIDERKPAYNLARIASNVAAGIGRQAQLQEDRERVLHLRAQVVQETIKLHERLERFDDVGNILLTIQELS